MSDFVPIQLYREALDLLSDERIPEFCDLIKRHPELANPERTPDDETALIYVALRGDQGEALSALMDAGCPNYIATNSVLDLAINNLRPRAVKALIPYCADRLPATDGPQVGAFEKLCAMMANVAEAPPHHAATTGEHITQCFDALLPAMNVNRKAGNLTPLHSLTELNADSPKLIRAIDHIVKKLVEAGADTGVAGYMPPPAEYCLDQCVAATLPNARTRKERRPFLHSITLCGGMNDADKTQLVAHQSFCEAEHKVIAQARKQLRKLLEKNRDQPLASFLLTEDGTRASWMAHGFAGEGMLRELFSAKALNTREKLAAAVPVAEVLAATLPKDRRGQAEITSAEREMELERPDAVTLHSYIGGTEKRVRD